MSEHLMSIAEELQQRRAFATVAEETMVAVMRTGALVKRALSERVAPHGISLAQYNVLRILRGAGAEGLPTLAVRDRLIEEAPGITRLIDKLERGGFVRRDRTGRDRRTVRCHITPAGLELLDRIDAPMRGAHALVNAAIPEATAQQRLLELLSMLRSVML